MALMLILIQMVCQDIKGQKMIPKIRNYDN
jgi:hypothetical protein